MFPEPPLLHLQLMNRLASTCRPWYLNIRSPGSTWPASVITVKDAALTAKASVDPRWRSVWVSVIGLSLSPSSIMRLASWCPHLQSLNLREGATPTQATIDALAEHCPQLSRLAIGPRSKGSMSCGFSRVPSLRAIELKAVEGVTDETVASLLEVCPALVRLGLDGCAVTDIGLAAIAAEPRMEWLDLSSNHQLTKPWQRRRTADTDVL